jgi:hypothetical protein
MLTTGDIKMKTSLKVFITSMFSEIISHASLSHLKRAIILILLLSPVIQMKGQTLNLQAGPSISKLITKLQRFGEEDIYIQGFRSGLNVSAGIDYWDHKYFNLSSNVGFIQKGGNDTVHYFTKYDYNDSAVPCFVRLNYITLNTAFVFKVPIKNHFIPYLIAGPRFDYLVSFNDPESIIDYILTSTGFDNFLYGLLTGVGVDYNTNKFSLGIVFNYYINLKKIYDYSGSFPEESGFADRWHFGHSINDRTFTLNFRIGCKL